jgi:RNA polymerase sigma factor (sigma-70 family)
VVIELIIDFRAGPLQKPARYRLSVWSPVQDAHRTRVSQCRACIARQSSGAELEKILSCSTDRFFHQLSSSRASLLRAAHRTLRNHDWAEDAVSETLLAALERPPGFDEAARLRAWLLGILRHKIVDQFRLHLASNLVRTVGDAHDLDDLASPAGAAGSDPVQHTADAQFIAALGQLLTELPESHARAFVQRECWGHETADVCSELGISAGNLWVMLHRARGRLREGLQAHRD